MDTLLYIDNYFTGEPSPEMKKEFEERISKDSSFAEEVAFYLTARQASKEPDVTINNDRFKELYDWYKRASNIETKKPAIQRKLWPYIAAAAVIGAIIIGWAVFFQSASPAQLADNYVRENFNTLGVTMSGREDSLQTGLRLYNEGKLDEALNQFESIIRRDTSSFEEKKYAGIVALRLNDYDKAILYFTQLEKYTHLYANPGKFYHALTLLKRNRPADKQEAKNLLEQVVLDDLDGKPTAQEWLRNF